MSKPASPSLFDLTGRVILVTGATGVLAGSAARYLVAQGFRTTVAASGREMEECLAVNRFDLVVLDLMLPGEDGLSACRRLRASNNQVPIIMLTAKGDESSRIQGLELGADDYLAKPFNPRELLARIKAVLRRQAPQ
eukprot:gene13917-17002_t